MIELVLTLIPSPDLSMTAPYRQGMGMGMRMEMEMEMGTNLDDPDNLCCDHQGDWDKLREDDEPSRAAGYHFNHKCPLVFIVK